ncbi:MAG: DUF58 domain-containing protein [Pyrinomonadaceae bacterium]
MKLSDLTQLLTLRDIRNAILGLSVIIGGLGLTLFTLWAARSGDARLAGISAAVSLLFVVVIIIFVVPPLARNARRETSQMNLPFEFTAGGAIVLGLIAIVGFSAWNTGNNLLFLVLSFLTAAMIVGFVAGSISLKKLDVRMRFPETIFAGQETPIMVSIQNRKRLFGSYSVVAEVRGRERERSIAADDLEQLLPHKMAAWLSKPPLVRRTLGHFVFVPRRETVEQRTVHVFERRGRFTIKDFELSTKFPFGFFRHRRRLPARETELIVFPEPAPLGVDLEVGPLDAGALAVNRRGLGHDLLALRDYQPNDDLRRVDWKATARSRRLTVREYTAEDDRRVTIIFDLRMPSAAALGISLRDKLEAEQKGSLLPVSARFEHGVGVAAAVLTHFTEQQAEIEFIVGGERGEPGIGPRHLYDCLRRLAAVEPQFIVDENLVSEPAHDLTRIEGDTDDPRRSRFLITAFEPDGGGRHGSETPSAPVQVITF